MSHILITDFFDTLAVSPLELLCNVFNPVLYVFIGCLVKTFFIDPKLNLWLKSINTAKGLKRVSVRARAYVYLHSIKYQESQESQVQIQKVSWRGPSSS